MSQTSCRMILSLVIYWCYSIFLHGVPVQYMNIWTCCSVKLGSISPFVTLSSFVISHCVYQCSKIIWASKWNPWVVLGEAHAVLPAVRTKWTSRVTSVSDWSLRTAEEAGVRRGRDRGWASMKGIRGSHRSAPLTAAENTLCVCVLITWKTQGTVGDLSTTVFYPIPFPACVPFYPTQLLCVLNVLESPE